MQEGYEGHYIKFVKENDPNSMEGLALINVDHTCVADLRAYIRHISSVDPANFKDILMETIDFIWEKLNPDTIRLDIYHFRDKNAPQSSMRADPDIKAAIAMEKKGFKWKTLINDPETGKRYQIMQLNKPKDAQPNNYIENNRKMKLRQEPLSIKAGMLLRIYKQLILEVSDRSTP
jgi:hypothetical protein